MIPLWFWRAKADKMRRQFNISAHWSRLPLELRQRWWRETDYGRKDPPEELCREIETYEAPK